MKLLGKQKAQLTITDPPYGVSYNLKEKFVKNQINGKTKEHFDHWKAMKGDESSKTALAALPLIFTNLIPNGTAYITAGTNLAVDIVNWLRKNSIHYGVLMVWIKEATTISWNRYHPQHENIIYCGTGSSPGGKARWFGPKQESTVWNIPIDAYNHNRLHPTQKPVALYERALVNSSAPGEIVLDPFAGSGTVAIAAEKHGRRAYMMELAPTHCQTIIKRWEEYTHQKATPLHHRS